MKTFFYKTKICTWLIRDYQGQWLLQWRVNRMNETSGRFSDPVSAANDVAHQLTGFYDWDTAPGHPLEIEDISNWGVLE